MRQARRKTVDECRSAKRTRLIALALLLASAIFFSSGCRRHNQDDFDDRTLEKKTHVETEKFPDKNDPFRP